MTVDEPVHKKLMDNFKDYDKITIVARSSISRAFVGD